MPRRQTRKHWMRVDKAALAMLDRTQPFPPMPAGMIEPALSFSVPLRFC